MLVRLIYTVRRLYARRGERIEVGVQEGDLTVAVTVAKEPDPEHSDRSIVVLTATTSVEPANRTSVALSRVASGSEPSDGLAEYGSTISLQLAAAMVRVYDLVRWRSNAAGPDHPYTFRTVEFSLDQGASWSRLPTPTRASLLRSGALDLEGELAANVTT